MFYNKGNGLSGIEIFGNDSSSLSSVTSREMTFKEYQSVYSELTMKSETLERKYQKRFELSKTNIAHLHDIVKTTLSQYHVVGLNSNVIVSQSDKTTKVSSSVENFLMVETLTRAVESIYIEYNLLIQLPDIEKKQNYKISIQLVSDLIVFESIRDTIPHELADLIDRNNISIRIDYVDYTIAKSIVHNFDEWVEDISLRDSKFITFLSSWKNYIATSTKFAIILISLYLIYYKIPDYISMTTLNMQITVKFLLLSAILFYMADKLGIAVYRFILKNLVYLQSFSAIIITAEDKKNFSEYEKKRKTRIGATLATIFLTLGYGVISSVIASRYFGAN